jgi:hypothetical protein
MKNKDIFVTIILLITVLLFIGCMDNNNSNNINNNGSWLDDYSPYHGVGTGSNDFWIEFPTGSENSGQTINHLPWIMDSLKSNCVVFVVHKTGCIGCADQAERVINLAGTYENLVEFYDLDIPLGGDIEQKAYDSYLYDPDGPPGYIALTGVYTYVKQDREPKVGWHSWEGDVADSEMENWIKDAIYYHYRNKDDV